MPTHTRFIEVPAHAIHTLMNTTKFKRAALPRAKEEVFERVHERDPRYVVRVYTSITKGEKFARECSKDAIRVVAVYEDPRTGKTRGIYKAKRIHRTGTVEKVIERTHERMREAYKAISDYLDEEARRRRAEEARSRPQKQTAFRGQQRDDGRTGHVIYINAEPTESQLDYIRKLGGDPPPDLTRGGAARLIDQLKKNAGGT